MSDVLEQFASKFNRCWLCGTMAIHTWPPELQIHHCVRGPNRSKAREEVCTLIRTCGRCHSELLDSMPIARQLALIKRNNEPAYDRIKVNTLRGRAPEAIGETEVIEEMIWLDALDTDNDGYPYPRWRF